MNIQEFISNYRNHPVLFIGTGLSLRYLENSYSWDSLLKKVASDFNPNLEYYFDIKAEHKQPIGYAFDQIATQLEKDFNQHLKDNRHGKFEHINDLFYANMKKEINISRFKLYLADLLREVKIRDSALPEIVELKKARKNISSVITTNYI